MWENVEILLQYRCLKDLACVWFCGVFGGGFFGGGVFFFFLLTLSISCL